MTTRLVFDIETDGLLPTMTKIHCICWHEERKPGEWVMHWCDASTGFATALRKLAEADEIIGHNIVDFDIRAIQKLYPDFKPKGVLDTKIMSNLLWADIKEQDFKLRKVKGPDALPGNLIGAHSLKSWGYRLGILKGDFHESTDWKIYTPEMLEYCCQDVRVTTALLQRIEAKEPSRESIIIEHRFKEIMLHQEAHGFRFDVEAAAKLYGKLAKRRQELTEELEGACEGWYQETKQPSGWYIDVEGITYDAPTKAEVVKEAAFGCATMAVKRTKKALAESAYPGAPKQRHIPFNPLSRDHVARFLSEKYGWKPKKFTETGKAAVDEAVLKKLKYPEAATLAELYMVNKLVAQLAEGPQAWMKLEKDGRIHGRVNTNAAVTGRCTHARPNMSQVPGVAKPYGEECRSLFLPDQGHVLVGADASGIEARMLAHYLGKWDNGRFKDAILRGDIHSENQAAAGLPTRDNAKTFFYGFLYGAGDEKIGKIVGGGKQQGRQLKARFIARLPGLKHLLEAVKRQAQKGFMPGLDGRKVKVRSSHAALNSLLQSAGAIAMKKAVMIFWDLAKARGWEHGKDFGLCVNSHDEEQISARPEIAEDVGRLFVIAIRRAGRAFALRCPLDGEFKIGENWARTH